MISPKQPQLHPCATKHPSLRGHRESMYANAAAWIGPCQVAIAMRPRNLRYAALFRLANDPSDPTISSRRSRMLDSRRFAVVAAASNAFVGSSAWPLNKGLVTTASLMFRFVDLLEAAPPASDPYILADSRCFSGEASREAPASSPEGAAEPNDTPDAIPEPQGLL